jgi:hypothetical protein
VGQDVNLRADCSIGAAGRSPACFRNAGGLAAALFLRFYSYPPQTPQYHETSAAKTAGVAQTVTTLLPH